LEVGPDWLIRGGMCRPLVLDTGANYYYATLDNTRWTDDLYVHMNNEYSLGCEDGVFDVVFSLNVAEHVRKIWKWVAELKRVTRPGGTLIFVSPVSWPYHESPYDCWRIFPEGYRALFDEVGLEYVFGWSGNMCTLESALVAEHGPHEVRDTIAVARRPGV
jgi:SAM-dependent methyltransferase